MLGTGHGSGMKIQTASQTVPADFPCCLGSISLKIENGLNSELEGTNGRDAFV